MFRYFDRLYEKFDLSVYPVAIFSDDYPGTVEESCHLVAFPNKVVDRCDFDSLQLEKFER